MSDVTRSRSSSPRYRSFGDSSPTSSADASPTSSRDASPRGERLQEKEGPREAWTLPLGAMLENLPLDDLRRLSGSSAGAAALLALVDHGTVPVEPESFQACVKFLVERNEVRVISDLLTHYAPPDPASFNFCVKALLPHAAMIDSLAAVLKASQSDTFKHVGLQNLQVNNLARALEGNQKIVAIDVKGMLLTAEHAKAASELLRNPALRKLSFTRARIHQAALNEATKALSSCRLAQLDFYGSDLSAGIQQLEKALQSNETLQFLGLGYCGIGTSDLCALGRALLTNTTLERLDLSGNILGNDGGIPIASILSVNTALVSLDLAHCSMTPHAVTGIAQVLQGNATLTHLDLSGDNGLDEGAVRAVADMLKINRTLTHLALPKAVLNGGHHRKLLAGALRENPSILSLGDAIPTLEDDAQSDPPRDELEFLLRRNRRWAADEAYRAYLGGAAAGVMESVYRATHNMANSPSFTDPAHNMAAHLDLATLTQLPSVSKAAEAAALRAVDTQVARTRGAGATGNRPARDETDPDTVD